MDRLGEAVLVAKVPKGERVLVGVMVVLYLAVTAWLSWEVNVWRDEMYSLHSSAGSVANAARQAIDFELQPPLYFALLAAWRTLDDSIFFARLLSSLFGAGAVLAIAALARRVVPRMNPAYAAALLATHPFVVWAGTEIRVYALVVLLSALLTLTFVDAYWLGPPRPRARLAFAAVAIASLYTQYYLSIVLVAFGTALLVRRERPRFVAFAIDSAAVGLLSLPLLLALRAQLVSHHEDLARPVIGVEAIRLVVTRFELYLFSFNEAIDKSGWGRSAVRVARWIYRGVIAAAVGIGFLQMRRRSQVERGLFAGRSMSRAIPVVAGIGAYAVCIAALFVIIGPMSVGERHTAGLLVPAMLAAIALPAVAIGTRAAHAWSLLLLASNLAATTLTQAVPLAKDCDCRHVAETIVRREAPREPILVFPSEDVLPLSVYYRGQNRLIPVPAAPSYDRWDQSTFVIQSPDDVARLVELEAPGGVGLWVHTNTYGPRWGPDKLEAFLAGGYRRDGRILFQRGVVLRHFVRLGATSTPVASP